MKTFERLCVSIRHSRLLRNQHVLWNRIRPCYDFVWQFAPASWSHRNVNGTDTIAVQSRWRDGIETYEADVWPHVMSEIRVGDTFVDVGAFIGVYAIAVAKRVGVTGKVIAFEPDPFNFAVLRQHVQLNDVHGTVVALNVAVAASDGEMCFEARAGSQSALVSEETLQTVRIPTRSLDSWCRDTRVDVLKIDVEGFEHSVLEGARALLSDVHRRPRVIFIEVHPYAWSASGATSHGILALLHSVGYQARTLEGSPIHLLERYGEIVAAPAI